MGLKTDKHISVRSSLFLAIEAGLGIVIAVLFWFVVAVIIMVATWSSKSPWDTVIAALAMASQAFFAFVVWRLGKAQYAFTKQVTERQHKIDMYPLRRSAATQLQKAAEVLYGPTSLSDDDVELFRQCNLEITSLFSDEANELSFELYQLVESAHTLFLRAPPEYDVGGSITMPGDPEIIAQATSAVDSAFDVLTDLQSLMDNEMRIL